MYIGIDSMLYTQTEYAWNIKNFQMILFLMYLQTKRIYTSSFLPRSFTTE